MSVKKFREKRIKDLMKPAEAYQEYEVTGSTEIKEASKKLEKNPGHMVIVVDNDRKVKGLLTQTDIVKNIGRGINLDASAKIEDFMNRDFVRISENKTVDTAISLMNSIGVNKIIVVDKDGKFIGVLHKLDLIREARELL
jgi:predicted transcriptional regulator